MGVIVYEVLEIEDTLQANLDEFVFVIGGIHQIIPHQSQRADKPLHFSPLPLHWKIYFKKY